MTNETLKRLKEQAKEQAKADNQLQIRNDQLTEQLEQSVTREEIQLMIDKAAQESEKRLSSMMNEKLRDNNSQLGQVLREEISRRIRQDYPKPKQIAQLGGRLPVR